MEQTIWWVGLLINKSRQSHGQLLLVLNTQIYWNVGRRGIQIDRRTSFPLTAGGNLFPLAG